MDRLSAVFGERVQFRYTCLDRIVLNGSDLATALGLTKSDTGGEVFEYIEVATTKSPGRPNAAGQSI